jgi:hypothetical protein
MRNGRDGDQHVRLPERGWPRLRRDLETLIALTGGVVVAVALFDVLPEAHGHHSSLRVSLTAIGFVAIFGVSLLVH